ncbi:MAG: hypothetical protein SFU99_14665 [Saprospiraceae bacterium]|nr:hypothetical protein [Saprospiraceae bacterium]
MRKEKEIPITEEDLQYIVADEFEQIMDLALHNSFCSKCLGKHPVEMIDYHLFLNDLNDVVFKGKCKSCEGNIARYVEIGEQGKFRMRTEVVKERKRRL